MIPVDEQEGLVVSCQASADFRQFQAPVSLRPHESKIPQLHHDENPVFPHGFRYKEQVFHVAMKIAEQADAGSDLQRLRCVRVGHSCGVSSGQWIDSMETTSVEFRVVKSTPSTLRLILNLIRRPTVHSSIPSSITNSSSRRSNDPAGLPVRGTRRNTIRSKSMS
jgi:hypothetical protein